MPHSAFDSLPIIDLSVANSTETKPQFLQELRHALFNIGFMYIKNTGIPDVEPM
jgi:isopenicillin N synthase-like dioxygenase